MSTSSCTVQGSSNSEYSVFMMHLALTIPSPFSHPSCLPLTWQMHHNLSLFAEDYAPKSRHIEKHITTVHLGFVSSYKFKSTLRFRFNITFVVLLSPLKWMTMVSLLIARSFHELYLYYSYNYSTEDRKL